MNNLIHFLSGVRATVMALAILCLAQQILAQQVEFNYNGRLNVQSGPFTGTGSFKLALTNADGTVTYWANDGVTLDGDEPTNAVAVAMHDGFFSINIGDTALDGMAELSASIFNNGDVYLRTWFNDGTSGFQRLLPDKKIVNPDLLGLINRNANSTIYVDPVNGNDQNSGLIIQHPKLTIQAAWNTIPPLVARSITIQLLDGVYHEEVNLTGKTPVGEATLTINGNATDRSRVRLTGYDSGKTTITLARAISAKNQLRLHFTNLSFDRYSGAAIFLIASEVEMENCSLSASDIGVYASNLSKIKLMDVEVYNMQRHPLYIQQNSIGTVDDSYMHHCGAEVAVFFNAVLGVATSRFANMNPAFNTSYGGTLSFNINLHPFTIIENCPVGVRVSGNGTLCFANDAVTYINTPTHISTLSGTPSVIF